MEKNNKKKKFKKENKDQDEFGFIAEIIQRLYEYAQEKGMGLNIMSIEPYDKDLIDEDDDYISTQLVWSSAEAYEILECLNIDSIFYKGGRITRNEITDTMIDLSIEGLKELEEQGVD